MLSAANAPSATRPGCLLVAPVDAAAATMLLAFLLLRRQPSRLMLPNAAGLLLVVVLPALPAADSDTATLVTLGVACTSLSGSTSVVECVEIRVGL